MAEERGRIMLAVARSAIAAKLGRPFTADESAPWLSERGACFVTLTLRGGLRGCIGSLEPYRPLLQDLQENACAAAFSDPRFPPLNAREFDAMMVEVSLLSSVSPMTFHDEADVLAQLRPGIDGVILEYGRHRGTFLPQVWEQLPEPREFLAHLKMKAGLPPGFWADGIRLFRYTVEKYKEELPPGPKT